MSLLVNITKTSLHRPHLWVFALYFIVPLLSFPEIIWGKRTLYWSDLSWIHYPRHIFAAEEWLAGWVPLWDPFQHNGLPFLAETQVGALYPLSALFLSSLSPALELSWFILIHFSLAALFTFILARSLGLSLAASTVSGLAFGCGGFLMAQVSNLNIMTGAVWLPLILYGIIRATQGRPDCPPLEQESSPKHSRQQPGRSWLRAMLAGIPLTLQILTAQPQIVLYTLVTIGGYGVYRIVSDYMSRSSAHKGDARYGIQTALLLSTAVVSGLLLAAPQLLPTLELQQLSVRSEERGFAFLTRNSLPPVMGVNLLLPSAFGNNVVGFKGGDPFQEDFVYVGFLPFLLILFSLRQRHSRNMIFFLLLLIGAILLAMGRFTPLYQYVIQYMPGFSLFRIPSRWLMVVNLALAILAGYGLESLLTNRLSKSQLTLIVVISFSLIAGVGLIWFFRAEASNWGAGWSPSNQKLWAVFLKNGFVANPVYRDRLLLGKLIFLTVPTYLLIANVMLAAGLCTLFALGKVSDNFFSITLIGAVSIDLILAGGTTINPLKSDSWWHQLSGGAQYILENIDQARVFPLGMGSERATVTHLGQYFPSVYRIRSAGGHGSSLMLERTRTFLDQAHPVQAIQVLGVRYLLTEGQMGADAAAAFPIAYQDADAVVYQNEAPLSRTFVVHSAIQVDGADEALAFFQTNTLDPRQTVILEDSTVSIPSPQASNGSTATIVTETAQTIEISVDAGAPGYLVLLDTYYPGWVATLDGQSTPIYRANYVGRAIFVPGGRHTVWFRYQPHSFKIGLWLSLLMLLTLTTVAVIEKQRFRAC